MERESKGNPHPTIKTCYSRSVVGYNLTTGERRQWKSVRQAAESVGMNQSWFNHLLKENRPSNGWLCAYAEDESVIEERLCYYRRSGKFAKNASKKKRQTDGLVALRLDRRTVIYVNPDEATPEYAQQYLNKIKGIKDEQD